MTYNSAYESYIDKKMFNSAMGIDEDIKFEK
jgi:hypothetical protein